jgi:hypothetical protein
MRDQLLFAVMPRLAVFSIVVALVVQSARVIAVRVDLEPMTDTSDGRRCLAHLRFDVMWRGKRYRMPMNDFAIPRMDQGKQRPIQSMEEARDWERLFIGEIMA